MGQTQKNKPAPSQQEQVKKTKAKDLSEEKEKLKEDLDALVDEIDDVLEKDAESFIKAYIQRGGQ